eukprot:scaffold44_cov152-Amphora_coffeaeformis.AAC.3
MRNEVGGNEVSLLGLVTFLRLVGGLSARRYDCQCRREDAAGKTDVAESCPMLWVDELAERCNAPSPAATDLPRPIA